MKSSTKNMSLPTNFQNLKLHTIHLKIRILEKQHFLLKCHKVKPHIMISRLLLYLKNYKVVLL